MSQTKRVSALKVKASLIALLKPEPSKPSTHPYAWAMNLERQEHNCKVREVASKMGIIL